MDRLLTREDLFITTHKEVERYCAQVNKLSCYNVADWLKKVVEQIDRENLTIEDVKRLFNNSIIHCMEEGAVYEAKEAMI